MTTSELLLQRFHDGELPVAQAAAVRHLIAEKPYLSAISTRLDALDGVMRERTHSLVEADPEDFVKHLMGLVPAATPKKQVAISMGQLGAAAAGIFLLALCYGMSILVRDFNLMPMGTMAFLIGFFGLTLVIAARPLMRFEASFLSRLMRHRLAVGDKEVLVCRLFGVALIIGGIHLIGLWG